VRDFKFLCALALATVIAATLGACAGNHASRAAMLSPGFENAAGFSGSYLAGRFAQRQQDWSSAESYMNRVLSYDAQNDEILQRTFLLALGAGDFAHARDLAAKITAAKRGGDEMAIIYLACEDIHAKKYDGALARLRRLPAEGFGQYTKPLLSAWAMAGKGDKAGALRLLAANASPDDPSYRLHAGLMEELTGDNKAAAAHYKVAMANGLGLHTAVMVARFFSRTGEEAINHEIYKGLDKVYPYNPFIKALAQGGHDKAPSLTEAPEGASLALFELATLLYDKRAYDSAQIYARLVETLSPRSPLAELITGDIAALHGNFTAAAAAYAAIPPAAPVYWIAQVRMAEAYESGGQSEKAIAMLGGLSKEKVTRVPALVSLGDLYRRLENYEAALAAYNAALAGTESPQRAQWPIIYARGMTQERLGNWELAEKDLQTALSFQPENPMILNFLAYSWAGRGIHLQKALEYARHAVALRPDDGYILDSYGWTLFRLAQYHESVIWLEQAVSQMPGDPTLLDHLGDAYWLAGRHDEARYQWKHAQDLSADPAFKTLAQQKMQYGIRTPSLTAQND